jgi:hypothetical protein
MKSPGYVFLREIIAVFLEVFNDVVSNFFVACNFKWRSLLPGILEVEFVA